MKTPSSDLVNNYIQSFIYSFEAAYDSSHEVVDDVIIFYYGQEFINSPSEVTPYQSIVFSPNKSPEEIHKVIESYPFKGDGSFAINVFHEDSNPQNIKAQYKQLGYEYYLPNILQAAELPSRIECVDVQIHTPTELEEADFINSTFKNFKPFPKKIIGENRISSVYAVIDSIAVGWGYVVYNNSTTAYGAGLFTLPEYRRRGIATAIIDELQNIAYTEGAHQILLAPSFMAWNFYSERGYKTIIYFSTFIPSGMMKPNA